MIERSAVDGQVTFHKSLDTEVRAYIKAHAAEFGGAAGGDDDEAEEQEAKPEPPKASASSSMLSSIGFHDESPIILFVLLALVVFLIGINVQTYRALRRARSGMSGDVEEVMRLLREAESKMDTLKQRAARLAAAV